MKTVNRRPLILPSPARVGRVANPPHKGAGFTLVEILVVISIIGVLMALLFPVFSAIHKRKPILEATAEVKAIAAAMEAYKEALGNYPPDTDEYGTGDTPEEGTAIDRASICKYLATEIQDSRTKVKYGPFFKIDWNHRERIDGIRNSATPDYWIYLDPWGHPYHVDSEHIIITADATRGKVSVQVVGEPYPAGMADPTLKIDKVRVWSDGPDGKMANGSNVENGKGPAPEDQDNITSWAD